MIQHFKRSVNRYRPNIEQRTMVLSLVVASCFAVVFIRAIDLHWLQSDRLSARAKQQQFHQFNVGAARGPILDRHGRILSKSIETPSIGLVVEKVPVERLTELADALEMDAQALRRRLNRHKKGFIWVKRQTTPSIAMAVEELKLPGVRVETEWRRFYPLGPETGHLLGFVGIDGHGLEGLEHSHDRHLTGEHGVRASRRDAHGNSLPGSAWLRKPQTGRTLQLTLDSSIQSMAYAALADGVQKHHARSGSVVVMNPANGEILAMASLPGFNPNNFSQFSPNEWRNRAITDVFEPGSTMKPFTVAAALESGDWTSDSPVFCENGKFKVADHTIHDSHGLGWETLKGVLMHSSNIGAAKVALTLGAKRLHEELTRFGFSQRTGIDIEGEAAGLLAKPRHWGSIETANIAFGQGIAVTTLQLAVAFSTLANHGVRIAPVILFNQDKPQSKRIISTETSAVIEDMLVAAVSRDGTGNKSVPKGYSAAGKTGTAQRADEKGEYSAHHYTSVFAGYVPVEKPELVIVVVVDEPVGAYYGGLVAAPIFRQIAASALPYLGVSPRLGVEHEELGGDGALLQAALTHSPDMDARGLNFLGLSLRESYRLAARLGLELRTHGMGWVVRQIPLYPDQLSAQNFVEVWLDE